MFSRFATDSPTWLIKLSQLNTMLEILAPCLLRTVASLLNLAILKGSPIFAVGLNRLQTSIMREVPSDYYDSGAPSR